MKSPPLRKKPKTSVEKLTRFLLGRESVLSRAPSPDFIPIDELRVREIGSPLPRRQKYSYAKKGKQVKYSDDVVRQARALREEGHSYPEIAIRTNTSPSWVASVINGVFRTDVK